MGRKDNSVLGRLDAKKVELAGSVEGDLASASYHEAEAKSLRTLAATSEKQVTAIEEAQGILSAAGVHF